MKKNSRRLSIEPLEDRSLLSVALGISPSVLPTSAAGLSGATQAPSGPSGTVASQMFLRLPPMVPAAVPVQVVAFATDAQGVPYTGTATLTCTDTAATFGSNVSSGEVSFTNGKASFSVTFATAGSQSLTLTDDADNTITATASTTVMTAPSPTPIPTPVAATQLAILLPPRCPKACRY